MILLHPLDFKWNQVDFMQLQERETKQWNR